MAMVVLLTGSRAMDTIEFKDGNTHDIDYNIGDGISVDANSPGVGTTVNLLPGGVCNFVDANEDSVFNLSGGYIGDWFAARRNSQVTVSSGSTGGALHASDSSDIVVTGGSIGVWDWAGLWTWGDQVTVSISDGNVYQGLHLYSDSQVTISGGSIYGGAWWASVPDQGSLHARNSSRVTISGGSISDAIYDANQAIVTILGSDFAVDGNAVGYGEITSILGGPPEDETARRLTGTLASGEPIDANFYIGDTAKIVLVPLFELGDLNGDGNVDNLDITPFVAALTAVDEAAFLELYPDGEYWAGDVNEDGNVDNLDITPFVNILSGGGQVVPEPATMGLLLIGTLAVRLRRRRR